ncbi:MAG: hypothetical protein Q4E94_03860, partial [Clostridia bacterium]|nr:hypothetical protein [Clostridia bacterium]
ILCSSCLDNPATICNCCGERIWRSDDEGDGNTDKSELIDYLKAKRLYVNEPITNPNRNGC